MKIIAETKESYFLVEVHKEELANILGDSSYYSISSTIRNLISTGKEIGVSQIYKNYDKAVSLTQSYTYSGSIERIKQELQKAIKFLEEFKPIVVELKKTLVEDENN